MTRTTTLLAALLLTLSACAGSGGDTTTGSTDGGSQTTVSQTATSDTTEASATTATTQADPLAPLAGLDEMTIIVNQSAGGDADTAMRILEPALEELLDLEVLVENVTDAGGVAGANEVFNGEPDGSVVGGLLIPRTMQQEVLLDTEYRTDDYAPILLFRRGTFALTVSTESRFEDLPQIIDASNETPISVGVTGPGSATDLQTAVLGDVVGAQFTRVPFDGAADVRTAVLGNNIDAGMLPLNASILDGQYRTLVVPTEERFGPYPDLPVLGDFGFPSADLSFYQGIFGPAGMSEDVRAALEHGFRLALQDENVKAQFESAGYFSVDLAGPDMTALINEQRAIVEQYIELLQGG